MTMTRNWHTRDLANHRITADELRADGYQLAGRVGPDAVETIRVSVVWRDDRGHVVYIMVVNGEFKKAGHTETPLSTRMRGSFNSLKHKMTDRADHPRYQEKTFKEHARATIRAGDEIELWAQSFESSEAMAREEDELNTHYCGEWTKEGWKRDGTRRVWGEDVRRRNR